MHETHIKDGTNLSERYSWITYCNKLSFSITKCLTSASIYPLNEIRRLKWNLQVALSEVEIVLSVSDLAFIWSVLICLTAIMSNFNKYSHTIVWVEFPTVGWRLWWTHLRFARTGGWNKSISLIDCFDRLIVLCSEAAQMPREPLELNTKRAVI